MAHPALLAIHDKGSFVVSQHRKMPRIVVVMKARTGEDDERRVYYRITPRGRKVARAEAERLADQVAAARMHRLLPEDRR